MAMLERDWSEADLFSWGSVERWYAHPCIHVEQARMRSHVGMHQAWRVVHQRTRAISTRITDAGRWRAHLGSGSSASVHTRKS